MVLVESYLGIYLVRCSANAGAVFGVSSSVLRLISAGGRRRQVIFPFDVIDTTRDCIRS